MEYTAYISKSRYSKFFMQFHGFTVSVVCEGKVLPEFAVQAEGDKTIACYLPSEVGKVCFSHGCFCGDWPVNTASRNSKFDGKTETAQGLTVTP